MRPRGAMSKKTCPFCAREFGNLTAHVKAKHADKLDEYKQLEAAEKAAKAEKAVKPVATKPAVVKPIINKPAKKKESKKQQEDELDAKIESNLEGDEDIVGDKADGSFLRGFKTWEDDFEEWWRDEQ